MLKLDGVKVKILLRLAGALLLAMAGEQVKPLESLLGPAMEQIGSPPAEKPLPSGAAVFLQPKQPEIDVRVLAL